jgi:hypothetical protein
VVELAGSLDGIGFKMGGFCFAIALGYVNRSRSPSFILCLFRANPSLPQRTHRPPDRGGDQRSAIR